MASASEAEVNSKIVVALQDFFGHVPSTQEPKSNNPAQRARELATAASLKAAAVSGTLAIPPGPMGLLTIIPDLVAVWKIQAQMVADIAGAYGKTAFLSKEQMLYCLFKHAAAQAVRDLVVRVGERVMIKRATLKMFQVILQKIGVKVTQRILGKGISRWLPIIGALGVAAYAYYDTGKVADTSIELFDTELVIDDTSGLVAEPA